jgi:3-carboxy-cis,cis-muconate cycloisomerase
VPLVWELGRVVGEPHGGWVHWGATTQNITQTGDLLVLRQAHRIFLRLIGEVLTAMADLAERGAEMPIAGRTHGQHAVPAIFGYKVAVWIDELIRHVERFRQGAPRLFVAMLGGGAGTFASLGAQGPAVQAAIGRQLGMASMTVPSRAIGDHLAGNICLLGMLAATCGKIAREIVTAQVAHPRPRQEVPSQED